MQRIRSIFACANPTPEIFPEEAKAGGAAVVATGRSDFPNQINNVLAFPVFSGCNGRAGVGHQRRDEDRRRLRHCNLVSDGEPDGRIHHARPFDPRVRDAVAQTVAAGPKKRGRKN
jgi:malate dehydrogenase (oxaloacetate-decarboxylating)